MRGVREAPGDMLTKSGHNHDCSALALPILWQYICEPWTIIPIFKRNYHACWCILLFTKSCYPKTLGLDSFKLKHFEFKRFNPKPHILILGATFSKGLNHRWAKFFQQKCNIHTPPIWWLTLQKLSTGPSTSKKWGINLRNARGRTHVCWF